MELEVLFAVVVGKLFAGLDGAEGEDLDSAVANPDLAIWSARVVDESSGIRRDVSIDHGCVTRPEEILAAVLPHLFGCCGTPQVFDHK